LTLCNTAQFLQASESALPIAQGLINEMASIARALGYDIEEEYVTSLVKRDIVWKGLYSSMFMDAKNSRQMEVEVGWGTSEASRSYSWHCG
jgi:2-dehydropantoate 2-reductase